MQLTERETYTDLCLNPKPDMITNAIIFLWMMQANKLINGEKGRASTSNLNLYILKYEGNTNLTLEQEKFKIQYNNSLDKEENKV